MKKKTFKGSTMLNPVPVVLVSSKNRKGEHNVFTVAWTGIVSSTPPLLYISVRPERLSYENIKGTGEFVVNLPSKDMTKELDYCGVRSGKTNDKIKECKFTMKDSTKIKTKYINECPINIECKVKDVMKFGGSHDMFLAEIVAVNVNEDLIDKNDKIHFDWAELIAYSHGEYFQMNKHRLGNFGFSVAKKRKVIKKKDKIMDKPKIASTKNSSPKNSTMEKSSTIIQKKKNSPKSTKDKNFSKEELDAKKIIRDFTKSKSKKDK